MSQINLASIKITEADLTEINACITTLHTKLLPYLKTLSPEDRMELPKMGDKTVSLFRKLSNIAAKIPTWSRRF